MAQLTVTQFATPIAIGQRGTMRPSDVTKAGPAEEIVRLGKGVFLSDTVDFNVRNPFAGGVFAGISYNSGKTEYNLTNNPTDPVYGIGDVVPYVQRGSVGVECEDDVAPGDPVYVRIANDGLLLKGNFKTNDGSTNGVWYFTITGTADTETVSIGPNTVTDATGNLEAFSAAIAAQPGVISSAVVGGDSIHITVQGELAVANAAVTGSGASVVLTEQTAGVDPVAVLVQSGKWLTSGTAGSPLEVEVNAP